MSRLSNELHRLYSNPSPTTAGETTRCLILRCSRPGAWPVLRSVWQGVQAELEWPAPAIAVDGVDATELWFSFEQPLLEEQALALGQSLCSRFAAETTAERIQVCLLAGAADAPGLPPMERLPGQWSAFVAPDLAAVFADDPWLDMPPGEDAQAELLASLRSVNPDATARLQPAHPTEPSVVAARALVAASGSRELSTSPVNPAGGHPVPAAPSGFTWPHAGPRSAQAFLQQIMNDPSVPLQLRVEAAKALLPHEVAGWGGSTSPGA